MPASTVTTSAARSLRCPWIRSAGRPCHSGLTFGPLERDESQKRWFFGVFGKRLEITGKRQM
jgi:hypothetical protein